MEVYKDYPYVTLGWDDEAKVAISTFKSGFMRAEAFKAAREEFLVLIKLKKAYKTLSDGREMAVLSQETQKWVSEDWAPRVLAAGVRYSAIIVPKDFLAKMSAEAIVSNSADMTAHYFDDQAAALKWLKEQT
jgi:hypothetical protein